MTRAPRDMDAVKEAGEMYERIVHTTTDVTPSTGLLIPAAPLPTPSMSSTTDSNNLFYLPIVAATLQQPASNPQQQQLEHITSQLHKLSIQVADTKKVGSTPTD